MYFIYIYLRFNLLVFVMAKTTLKTKLALRRIDKIQEVLRKEDLTVNEIAEKIYMSLRWAREYVKKLHNEGVIHIACYRRYDLSQQSAVRALYCWGSATDAVKPPPLTPYERTKRTRQLIYSDIDRHQKLLALRRDKKFKKEADWTSSWIPRRNVQQNMDAI